MSQNPYPQFAKEFMDIWQKHMASVMSDKQFIQSMLEMVQSMQMPNADIFKQQNPASHPANAPDTGNELYAQLAYRLSQCERRIAELEKAAERPTAKRQTAKKPARRGKTSPK